MTLETKSTPTSKAAHRLGSWSAALMAAIAAVAFAIAVLTPPLSGPFCQNGCFTYPYANAAPLVPHDYIWMIPGILVTPIFFILMVCIHYHALDDKKLFSQIGLSFALISALAITMDYFIQLTVMQPSLIKGEMEGLVLFSQYNPHGIFIALEDLGYLLMNTAFLFVVPVFAGGGKLERSIRRLFLISSLLAFGAFLVFSLVYGQNIEYRFEVAVLTINWITLIVSGVLLSILFKRAERSGLF